MLISLVLQAVAERKRFFIASALALVIYLAATGLLYPIIANEGGPVAAALEAINRTLFWTTNAPANALANWLNASVFVLVLPAAISFITARAVWGFTAAGQGRRQLGLVLSYPLPRRRIFGNITLFIAGVSLLYCAVSAIVMLLVVWGVPLTVRAGNAASMFLGLWLLCSLYGIIAFVAGNLTRKSRLGAAIVVGVFLLNVIIYLLPGFTPLSPSIRWISPISPYLEGNPLLIGFGVTGWLVLAGWVCTAGIAAWLHFERLDLG